MEELIRDREIELGLERLQYKEKGIINEYDCGEKVINELIALCGNVADYEAQWVTLTIKKKIFKYNLYGVYYIEDDCISDNVLLKRDIGFREICKLLKVIADGGMEIND